MSGGDMHLGRDLRDLLAEPSAPGTARRRSSCCVSPFLLVTWKYFGSPEYFAGTIAPWLGVGGRSAAGGRGLLVLFRASCSSA